MYAQVLNQTNVLVKTYWAITLHQYFTVYRQRFPNSATHYSHVHQETKLHLSQNDRVGINCTTIHYNSGRIRVRKVNAGVRVSLSTISVRVKLG